MGAESKVIEFEMDEADIAQIPHAGETAALNSDAQAGDEKEMLSRRCGLRNTQSHEALALSSPSSQTIMLKSIWYKGDLVYYLLKLENYANLSLSCET
ncbi:hypothetical protein Aperf_G00000035587 [Anoplocephala perfoliata]